MTNIPAFLSILIFGAVVGTALLGVAMVKTVRHHGWGKRTWAPGVLPWFVSAMMVFVVALAAAFIVSTAG
jgi:hypothetical protein